MSKMTKKELRQQQQELAQKQFTIDRLNRLLDSTYNGTISNRQRLAKYLLELPSGTKFRNINMREATGLTQRQLTDAKRNPYIRRALKIMQIYPISGMWQKI